MLFRMQMLWLRLLLAIAGARLALKQSELKSVRRRVPASNTTTTPSQSKARIRPDLILWLEIHWTRLRLALVGAQSILLRHDIEQSRSASDRAKAHMFLASFKRR